MIKTVEKPMMVVKPENYPDTSVPEFCLLGRSNVGKVRLLMPYSIVKILPIHRKILGRHKH